MIFLFLYHLKIGASWLVNGFVQAGIFGKVAFLLFLLFLWYILIFWSKKCWFIELNLLLSSDAVCRKQRKRNLFFKKKCFFLSFKSDSRYIWFVPPIRNWWQFLHSWNHFPLLHEMQFDWLCWLRALSSYLYTYFTTSFLRFLNNQYFITNYASKKLYSCRRKGLFQSSYITIVQDLWRFLARDSNYSNKRRYEMTKVWFLYT